MIFLVAKEPEKQVDLLVSETCASEQGRGSDDDQPNYEVQPNETLINYQSFMDKAPSTRWSKQDTELFYEV
jgi:transcription factor TFIIIB component B''